MYFSRLLYPVTVLGPGKRAGLWLCGCSRNCFNCANPELQEHNENNNIPISSVISLVSSLPSEVSGYTITGGEPFDQTEELAELITFLNTVTDDILVYSGYTYNELLMRKDDNTNYILDNIAVLIDGRYDENLNFGNKLKGSENQKVYVFREKYKCIYEKLDVCSESSRQTEGFVCNDGSIITAGFQEKNFKNDFNILLKHNITKRNDRE